MSKHGWASAAVAGGAALQAGNQIIVQVADVQIPGHFRVPCCH
jgi:hypothetical protein